MSLDLTGISNENEFYSHHYLAALLEDDLRDTFKRWKAEKDETEGAKEPWRPFRRLSQPLFQSRDAFDKERSPGERLRIQRAFMEKLLAVLGYDSRFRLLETDGPSIPLAAEVNRPSGAPHLWVIEALDAANEGQDVLELPVQTAQDPAAESGLDIAKLINDQVFFRDEPPRWVLVVSLSSIALFDRSKWSERRALRFDLEEILSRREDSTLRATVALLHRDSLCPEDGLPLLDTLDEQSHKHAFSVSQDLKYALRESVELLGNEAIWYLREVRREKVYDRDRAGDLTEECLRYMYRLLFLFYIEARPELGYIPLKSDAYRSGYALEKLRDLEMVRLETDTARNGTFLDASMRQIFRLIYDGFPRKASADQLDLESSEHHTFRIAPLKSHLFDPQRTPILERVRLRNHVVQRIIRLMSLSGGSRGHGKNAQRGRISYAQLGINQLGAVYEALLSYRGFFAEKDLYEVKRKADKYDELDQAFFVGADELEDYDEKEKVFEDDGTLKMYPRGTFIYRLAGRDREKSASYYTPEVLTECLVKYALKELLPGKTADEILSLTVCEPAMGSAAFLNEAISQLADAYLQRKQEELGATLSPDAYAEEKQQVKMYMADNNVYGVDLNPVAVELAEVSLWLNTLVKGGFVPWFGNQLKCGNSLVGARSQVFAAQQLKSSSGDSSWLNSIPKDVPVGTLPAEGSVYHFLVPDNGMAAYKNKVIKGLVPDELAHIKTWKKRFNQAFAPTEIKRVQRLSRQVEVLWKRHISELKRIEARTSDAFAVYGHPKPDEARTPTSTREKDRILDQELYSKGVRNKSPYRRLKLVMDYWCALWFWPIEKAQLLPTREEYLSDIELLLIGKGEIGGAIAGEQTMLFPDTMPRQLALALRDEIGYVDIDRLLEERPRLALVQALGERYRFHHWQLEFADQFAEKGGFDLVLGNPPWVQTQWNEGGIMGDAEPRFVIKKLSAAKLATLRNEALERAGAREAYLAEYEEADATQTFLNAHQNYAILEGMKANLYKCFLPVAWSIGSSGGVSGFLHPEGVYDDPKGGHLRRTVYRRLRSHFQFWNALFLFPEVHDQTKFSINIYGREREPRFDTMANLYSPPTVDACFEHDGSGPVPGIKNDEGNWDLSGHADRVVSIGPEELTIFASLYDDADTPALEARLPAVHSAQVLALLLAFQRADTRLADKPGVSSTVMWDENQEQQAGHLQKLEDFPLDITNFIVAGPTFFVSNPCYKTPRSVYLHNQSYDALDLEWIPAKYLPRSLFVAVGTPSQIRDRTPLIGTKHGARHIDQFRVATRRMVGPSSERTLIPSLLPPSVCHVNTVVSTTMSEAVDIVAFCGLCSSIVFDAFIKTTGRGDIYPDTLMLLPHWSDSRVVCRALLLNCLTEYFAPLWGECWEPSFVQMSWSRVDDRLGPSLAPRRTCKWDLQSPLRNSYSRRQALVEIDVLVAQRMGLTLGQLISTFRALFPLLRGYESDTWYDRNGRIIFTNSRGLTGVGLPRTKKSNDDATYGIVSPGRNESGIALGWEDVKDMKEGIVTKTFMDDTLPGGPVERTVEYHAPFDRCDREEDYAVAWAHFEKRFAEEDA